VTAGTDERLRQVLLPLPTAWEQTPLRRAAVLAPIFADAGEDWLLLLVRRPDLREHAGQIAFPGGADAGDPDPVACALREAREEVALRAEELTLLGSLQPRQSSSGYRVHCLVGRAAAPPTSFDSGEVERLLRIPLRALLELDRWYERAPPPAEGSRRHPPSPHFDWQGDVVWGLTGRFAHDLAARLAGR
jgi:8-oxo-dGTP pyrophosphatase MutT (NUDIX family)